MSNRSPGRPLLLLAMLFLPSALLAATPGQDRITFVEGGFSVVAERADTPETRQKGLMNRDRLKETEGMIFYMETSDYHAFWMYHTKIPLAILFIDESLRIVDVQTMEPCAASNAALCPVYKSRARCAYALEVNPRLLSKQRVRIGDRITISKQKP